MNTNTMGTYDSSASTLAAVLLEPGRMETREFPSPTTRSDDAVLEVEACGVCGADAEVYLGKSRWVPKSPVILGHEVVGRILDIGDEASARWNVQPGDRVVVEEPAPCGGCSACLSGSYHWCSVGPRYGATPISRSPALWGGYAERMYLAPGALVHKMSSAVPIEIAPLFIPISNGLHWVQTVGGAVVGSTVVIIGPGQHGLGCVVAAHAAGAASVIVIGAPSDAGRLDVARQLGADHTLTTDEDLRARVRELTDGKRADVVVNVANSSSALETAVAVVGLRGTVVNAGGGTATAQISPTDLIRKEVTIRGVAGRPYRAIDAAVRIIERGTYPLRLLATHAYGLDEAETAIRVVARAEPGSESAVHVSVLSARSLESASEASG